ncbi:TPA: hypothetical protein ACIRI1_001414, partial [Streptococcus suis]
LLNSKYFSSNTLMDLTNGRKRVRLPTPAQLKLSGRQFEVGDEANSVRLSRRGQIWSVKHEQICQSTTALRC